MNQTVESTFIQMFSVIVFTDIALFHLLDMSDSNVKHTGSNSSEPFIQMAQITHPGCTGI